MNNKEPKETLIIDEEEFINCPKCSKRFKTWHANVKYIEEPVYAIIGEEYMIIFCPRCSYITKRRPLDWNIK